ncbi:hypothetical protein Cfor_10577 [Coptotermes formosanus]|uniref:Tc1-like transposase DDE domain-containing protein n=1 Tax=Coptotermes formosanus TaxID=36987 RepID=A0A6L2Q8B3_COPFO|nr:hypothetical protein Cfor_10577 [Coptotermes formosanus]
MPQSSVWCILRKRLRVKGYRLQLLQVLNPQDHNLRFHFCVDFLQRLEEDRFAEKLVFSDEATFHECGNGNRHNVRIWGTENPHATVEHVRDSPKVNVFGAVSSRKVYGPFFFAEPTVTGINCLDMLQLWLLPQLQEDSEDFIFQQDGAPPHFHFDVRAHLSANLPGCWIGRASDNDSPVLPWPPRSPDVTVCDFFLWGYIKDRVYVPPMPRDLAQLRQSIVGAVAAVDRQMLQRV